MTEPRDASATDSADPVEASTGGSLGLPQATSLVLGTIIGVGVFNLPGSLASYGPISLVALGLTTVGAAALALLFASLSRRMPADGGPYAYARTAFGNVVGFSNAWLVLDHLMGGERGDRRGLGALRGAVHQHRAQQDGDDRPDPGRHLDRRGDQPARRGQHGPDPTVDLGAEVHPVAAHVHDRASAHRHRELRGCGTSAARAPGRRSVGRWHCACSPTSASSPPPSPRPRSAIPSATSRERRSWAPCSPQACTCCR